MKTNILHLLLAACVLFLAASCADDDDAAPSGNDDYDMITTAHLTFEGNGSVSSFSYIDLDGPGGDPPNQETVILDASSTYTLSIEFWDESVTPARNMTQFIRDNGTDFVVVSKNNTGSWGRQDFDTNSAPIGLEWLVSTVAPTSGIINLDLRRGANKANEATTGTSELDFNLAFIYQ